MCREFVENWVLAPIGVMLDYVDEFADSVIVV